MKRFLKWLLSFFKEDEVSELPPAVPAPVAVRRVPDVAPIEDEEEYTATVEAILAERPEEEPVVEVAEDNPNIRIINGVRHFWSALMGWTPVPLNAPGNHGADFKSSYEGPPFEWNMAGQIGQPRYKPDDWEEKGPAYDRSAYDKKYHQKIGGDLPPADHTADREYARKQREERGLPPIEYGKTGETNLSDINYYGFKPFRGAGQRSYDRMQMELEGFDTTGYKSNATPEERAVWRASYAEWLAKHGGKRPVVDPYVPPPK